MLKNYIKIAVRNLRNHPFHSLINIGGLALGITASLFILQYVSYEKSFDQFHEKSDQLYRISVDLYKDNALQSQSARVAPAAATSFQEAIPEIENFSRLIILGNDAVLSQNDQAIAEPDIYLADSKFLELFTFPLVQGNKTDALEKPFTVVISEKTASALFGETNPIGQTMVINSDNFDGTSMDFEVTGVMKNIPENSHIRPQVLISYSTLYQFVGHRFDDSWDWTETYTYVQLAKNASAASVEARFPEVVSKLSSAEADWQYHLQPITDIHLHSDLQYEASRNGNALYIYFLELTALLLLIAGYINYTNLTTAKASRRTAEVGIRKVSGAFRGQLISQFFVESLLINTLALCAAFALFEIASPWLAARLSIPTLEFSLQSWRYLAFFGVMLLSFSALSSFYPAFILSRFKPVDALRNFSQNKLSGKGFQRILVTTQLAVFVFLMAVTITVSRQISFMKSQDKGFSAEQILVVKAPKSIAGQSDFVRFCDQLSGQSQVQSISGSESIPGQEIYRYTDQASINSKPIPGVLSLMAVDPSFFEQFRITFVAGSTFKNPAANQWVINQQTASLLGFDDPEKAIGERLTIRGQEGEIAGVIHNYHHENLKKAIEPVVFLPTTAPNFFSVKTNSPDVLGTVQEQYKALFPGSPFEYHFLSDFYNQNYKSEEDFNLLFRLFSVLVLVVSFVGLLGLSSYTMEQRTKEIGIRKILGATVVQILSLISRDFIILVGISVVCAIPLAWFGANSWLADFAYRVSIGPSIFVLAGGSALALVLLVVGIQSVKVALSNPVESLRNE